MNITQFVDLFKGKMQELLKNEIVVPSNDSFDYNYGDWTFLFNCAVYDLAKEYNEHNKTKISLCAEPEAGKTPKGRCSYSDILICSRDKKKRYIMIEHENLENVSNPKDKLKSIVEKFSKSHATYNLLIAYWFKEFSKEQIINELKSATNGKSIYVLIAPEDIKSGYKYKLLEIKN